ncbi:hypothetical protein RUND412_000005 [Rhizina undulata]
MTIKMRMTNDARTPVSKNFPLDSYIGNNSLKNHDIRFHNSVDHGLLERHLELISENACLHQQLNCLMENNNSISKQMETLLQENEKLSKDLSKECAIADESQRCLTKATLEWDLMLDKVRLMENTLESIKAEILGRVAKQSELNSLGIIRSNVAVTVPSQDNKNSCSNRRKSSLQDVEVGESCSGKDGWIREYYQAVEHAFGSGEKSPEKLEETSETTFVASSTLQEPETGFRVNDEAEAIQPAQMEIRPEVPEMSKDLVKVSQLNVQPTTCGVHNGGTQTEATKEVPSAQDKSYLAVREIRFYDLPRGITYSDLSALVRGGKIEKMFIRDDRPSHTIIGLVLFAYAKDAIRFLYWSHQMNLFVGGKKVHISLGTSPPQSAFWLQAIEAGATRVLIFDNFPAKAMGQTKEGFINILQKKWMSLANSTSRQHEFDIECIERKAFILRRKLRSEGWTVSFGVDPCEGPIEELDTGRRYKSRHRTKYRKVEDSRLLAI